MSIKESKSFASNNEKSNIVTEVSSPSNVNKKASLQQETYNTQQTDRTAEKPTHVRYGTYRETYDQYSDKLNMMYFHVVPSFLEFESMIRHAASKQMEEEAKA